MKTLLTCLAMLAISSGLMAETHPFNLSLTPDIAVYDRTDTIEGVTLSIWGENQQTSLALGIVNGSVGQSGGFSWGLLLNYADDYTGVQWAPINYTKNDFLGWQAGFANYTKGSFQGLQSGAINYAGNLNGGLQLGFVNIAEKAEAGIQIGLVNALPQNERWFTGLPEELAPVMIFVNWRF